MVTASLASAHQKLPGDFFRGDSVDVAKLKVPVPPPFGVLWILPTQRPEPLERINQRPMKSLGCQRGIGEERAGQRMFSQISAIVKTPKRVVNVVGKRYKIRHTRMIASREGHNNGPVTRSAGLVTAAGKAAVYILTATGRKTKKFDAYFTQVTMISPDVPSGGFGINELKFCLIQSAANRTEPSACSRVSKALVVATVPLPASMIE